MNFTKNNSTLALMSLLAGAVLISFSGVWVKLSQVTPTSSAFYRVLFGGIILFALSAFNKELKWYGFRYLALLFLCALAFALGSLGLFSQVIGWILITNALPHVRTSYSGIILLIQPAMAFVWDVLFFHRSTTRINWVGVFLALSAIYIATRSKVSKVV